MILTDSEVAMRPPGDLRDYFFGAPGDLRASSAMTFLDHRATAGTTFWTFGITFFEPRDPRDGRMSVKPMEYQ